MNAAHIHLMITHLPIVGAFIGLIILLFAYLKKDANVKTAAYLVFIVCAIGASIAYTGNLGGKIRHTEIANASAALPSNEQPNNESDED
jgi:uncharacterized membrane protein